jgi:hypothetical protein
MRNAPYDYNPRFSAAFVLGDSPTDATGKRVSPWKNTTCTQSQHHCALALPEAAVLGLPDAAEKYVNLVVTADANGANAKSWHVMEVEQHHGALAVTRIAPGAQLGVIQKHSTTVLETNKLSVDKFGSGPPADKRRLYQAKLQGLKPGDVIDVDAQLRAYLGNYKCTPLITTEIIVSADPSATQPGANGARITVKNGRNCPDHTSDGCKYAESGAARLGSGAPSTMYVTYLATAGRSCAAGDGSNKWWLDPKYGFLDVNVRR